MKSFFRNRMVIATVVLAVTIGLVSIGGVALAAQSAADSGIPGLQGPSFTFGVVRLAATDSETPTGAAAAVFNGSPFAITGYALSKSPGSLHVWLSAGSQVVTDLGFKPGDIITIYCSESQVENINSGDWVQIAGFTARGQLVYAYQAVLPAPFGY